MNGRLTFLPLLLSMAPAMAAAQSPWTGILDGTRAENWQRANVGVAGGIPTNYSQCGSTIAPYGTSASPGDPGAINSAIAGCGPNTFVQLGAGTFYLSGSIAIQGLSNFMLVGSGPMQTDLVFSNASVGGDFSAPIFIGTVSGIYSGSASVTPPCGDSGASNCADWTGGYAQGSTTLTLANVGSTGILNGDVLVVDQQNDVGDTGGYMICDNDGTAVGQLEGASFQCMGNTQPAGNTGRILGAGCPSNTPCVPYAQEQFVRVISGCTTACSGTGPFTLTISPGLYANNWNQGAGASTTGVWFVKPVTQVGVEDLTVDATNCPDSIDCESGITFYNVDQGWAQNVRVLGTRRNHIWATNSDRIEVRDSYFYGTKNGESQSYGVEFYPAGDCLIENNIFQQIASPIMFGGGGGNVIGYNFSIDNVYGPASFDQGSYLSHSNGDYMNLWEGNVFNSLITDTLHGTSGLLTAFRNWINGLDWNTCTYSGGACTDTNNLANHPAYQTVAVFPASYARGLNVIGNVLGTPGYHTEYEYVTPAVPASTAACNQSIYLLGYGNGPGICEIGGSSGVADDPLVASTMMRWGNYDTVNAAVQWNMTEATPGAATYIDANPLPTTQSLPSSFYLSGRPSFFNTPQGTVAYPPIGPDVVGGNGGFFMSGTYAGGNCPVGLAAGGATCAAAVGGYANAIPAMSCYYNVMLGPADGSGPALSFDAAACYNSTVTTGATGASTGTIGTSSAATSGASSTGTGSSTGARATVGATTGTAASTSGSGSSAAGTAGTISSSTGATSGTGGKTVSGGCGCGSEADPAGLLALAGIGVLRRRRASIQR